MRKEAATRGELNANAEHEAGEGKVRSLPVENLKERRLTDAVNLSVIINTKKGRRLANRCPNQKTGNAGFVAMGAIIGGGESKFGPQAFTGKQPSLHSFRKCRLGV
eukprot:TRINITY_DN82253_c0_g1_i1.p1 TRINITY_DN82253_c0_g1~~TRINITY_DN82253_c0_g1_i1.p1  ORF type:complete len:106 (-),score=1.53 TRINITY_DN82253_c0_g1_i1:332-649(-)